MPVVNKNGALMMAIGADPSDLYRNLSQAEVRIDQFGNYVKKTGDKIGMALSAGFGGAILTNFAKEIVNVRGEMQMLESSFEVLLSGKGVSGFMSEMKQFAVDSPLSMNGVANAAQTLLGFGIAAEKVMPTIKQIGDISMGNEGRFKSLSLAFAQMSATGKLTAQDMNQMINAGFSPLQEISNRTGKSIAELRKEMDNGSISSQMVADAFASATAEGGKFYGMTQKQAEGIRGLQAQLEGALQDAFNEIGKSQEGLIAGGYKVATALVENYETVGKVLMALIATYGTYKAAVIAVNFVLKEQAAVNAMVAASNGVFSKSLAYQWVWTERVQKAQALLNKTMLTNPYILMGMAVVALSYGIYKLATYTTEAEKAIVKFNTELGKEQLELNGVFNAYKRANEGTDDKKKLLDIIKSKYGDYIKNLIDEKGRITDIEEAQKLANRALRESIALKVKNAAISDVATQEIKNQAEYLGGLRDIIAKRDGDEVANMMIGHIGQLFNDETKTIKQATDEALKYLKDGGYTTADKNGLTGKAIGAYLGQIRNSAQLVRNETKNIEDSFRGLVGDLNNPIDIYMPGDKNNISSFNEQLKSARENLAKLKKEMSDLRSGKTVSSNYAKDIEDKAKAIKEAEDKLSYLLTGQSSSASGKTNTQAESAAQKMRDAYLKVLNTQAELDNESVKQQLDHEQKLLDIEQDSFDKRYRQNQLNLRKESQSIKEYRQKMAKSQQDAAKDIYVSKNGTDTGFNFASYSNADLEKILPKGLKPSDIDAQVKNMMDAIVAAYKKGNEDLLKERAAAYKEQELLFASSLDQQLADIDAHYAQEIKMHEKDEEYISKLQENHLKERALAKEQYNQKLIQMENEYKEKVIEFATQNYIFQADKDAALLKQKIANNEKYIASRKEEFKKLTGLDFSTLNDDQINKLSEKYPELVNSIRNAELEQSKFNKFLNKTPAQKFAEIAGYVNEVVSSLSQLDGFEGIDKASSFFTSAAQFATGDYIGGSVSALTGLIGLFASSDERRWQVQKELNRLQQEYNISLRQQNADLISSVDYARAFRDNLESLHWLIEKGFISDVDYTAWDALSKRFDLLQKNIKEASSEYDSYMSKSASFLDRFYNTSVLNNVGRQIVQDWKNSKKTAEDTILALERLKAIGVSGPFEDWIDALKESNDEITNISSEIADIANQMDEFATGTDFDSFLSDAANAIKDLRGDISGLADFTEEKLTNAILSSFKYQILSNALKPMYDELANMFLGGDFDSSAANDWKQRLTDILKTNSEELDKIFEAFGVDPDTADTAASSKGIQSVTQDSFDKYLGNSYAQLQKMGDIRNINEALRVLLGGINNGVTDIQSIMREYNKVFQDSLEVYKKIEQNTAKAADILNKIETLGLIIRN